MNGALLKGGETHKKMYRAFFKLFSGVNESGRQWPWSLPGFKMKEAIWAAVG